MTREENNIRLEETLVELKNKVVDLEKSFQSCKKKLRKFQKKNQQTLIQHDLKIHKLTSKLHSVRANLKKGKALFTGQKLDTHVEVSGEDSANFLQIDLNNSGGSITRRNESSEMISNDVKTIFVSGDSFNMLKKMEKSMESDDSNLENESSSFELFRCLLCHETFHTLNALEIHNLHICSEFTKYGCPACPEYFKDIESLHDHLKTHMSHPVDCILKSRDSNVNEDKIAESKIIPRKRKYQCSSCFKIFKSRETFNCHLNNIHPEAARFRCNKCSLVFMTLPGLRIHEVSKWHLQKNYDGPIVYCCEKCGFSTPRIRNYHGHKRKCRKRNATFKCEQCESSFYNRTMLRFHRRQKHTELFQDHVCTICFLGFRALHHLKNHKAGHLKSTPYCCPSCKYYFLNPQSLNVHTKNCTANIEKPNNGAITNHTSKKQTANKEESNIKTSCNRKVTPENCKGDSFKQFSGIFTETKNNFEIARNRKITSHIRSTPSKDLQTLKGKFGINYDCKTCGKTLASKSGLTSHEKIHNKTLTDLGKKYACRFCKKNAFNKWTEFESHVRIHPQSLGLSKCLPSTNTDSKNVVKFQCSLCPKEFLAEGTLFSHFMYSHAWRKPHNCKRCPRSFCTLDGLKRHIKFHEKHEDPDFLVDIYCPN